MRNFSDYWPGIFLALVVVAVGLLETWAAPTAGRTAQLPLLPPLPQPPALELRLTSRANCRVAVTVDGDRRVFSSRELARRLGFPGRTK